MENEKPARLYRYTSNFKLMRQKLTQTTGSKSRANRSSILLDMTPMVDLAFLLVAFFMLTTQFAAEAPVTVHIPKSTDHVEASTNMLTLLISKEGKVFYDMDNQLKRAALIQEIGIKYGIHFNQRQIADFSTMNFFGMDIRQLPGFLSLSSEERKLVTQSGIPIEEANNQLAYWLVYSRMVNPQLRIAIKGDEAAAYPLVKKLIHTLQDNNINRFGLITDLELGKLN
ncbi:MAG: biopolymer transporter ExbD [Bacteroidota bacterium]